MHRTDLQQVLVDAIRNIDTNAITLDAAFSHFEGLFAM
jgi:hypothetical protein